MIVLDKNRALIDETFAIRFKGFSPRQPVTITATQTFYDSSRWQAHATFTSDDLGSVDVSRQAPISGTYNGISPMGLVWSAERLPGEAQPVSVGSIMRPLPIEIEAVSPDRTRAHARLERWIAGPGVTRRPMRSEEIVGTLFLPPGDGPHPAVLVVSGGGGGIDEFRGAILASHGYAALALGHFGLEGLPRGLVNIPLEYFENAIGWMCHQPWLANFLGVWGSSRGGELALLLGATFPEINGVIAWVPSGVVFWALGLAEPGDMRPRAAWSFRGKPLPYLQENNSGHDPEPEAEPGHPIAYTPFYQTFLRDSQAVERATIPVEKTQGPILLVSGTDDQMWPSSDLADIALRRLEVHRHPFPFRHLKYPGAGHLILVPYWPTTVRAIGLRVEGFSGYLYSQGGASKADADAGIDAWTNTLAFLKNAVDAYGSGDSNPTRD